MRPGIINNIQLPWKIHKSNAHAKDAERFSVRILGIVIPGETPRMITPARPLPHVISSHGILSGKSGVFDDQHPVLWRPTWSP